MQVVTSSIINVKFASNVNPIILKNQTPSSIINGSSTLKGLKKYGMFVADNGMDWLISIAPDERLKGLDDLHRVKPADFEVIVPTGPAGR